MTTPILTKKRIPLFIALVCGIELLVYLWSAWTSTFDAGNFFAIHSAFIFDKCARIAGRISSFIILIILLTVGYNSLKKIYADDRRKESFLILITLFTINHLIHLIYVIFRLITHGKSLTLNEPIELGGTLHGVITFATIVIIPLILWKFKHLSKLLYFVIIVYILNVCGFIIKTFLGKISIPDHPAYHNQFGIAVLSVASLYVLYSVYIENFGNKPVIK